MTLNDPDWLFGVKLFSRRFGWLRPENNCVKINKDRHILSACKSSAGTLVSGDIKLMQVFAGVP